MRKPLLPALACVIPMMLTAGCAATASGTPDMPATPANHCPDTAGWQAYIDAMPRVIDGSAPAQSNRRLIVTGEADLPDGASARLLMGPTDRMQPPGQRFTLDIVDGGNAPRLDSGPRKGWAMVRAVKEDALPAYSSVIISCGDEVIATIDEISTVY
ncbi:hypothetical protein G7A66_09575 [Altererythrobacter sp. SALINAS58]|uniref:hypothetical protein n=1 Tax=Alteripontixanthobacter muriae TaxID=2705546 RepID=UPI001575CC1B|nr:hypothetical protein [Alteripontixanthobacter muriae]NTZ43329.1 hypothetical protein [Alteripontixanthobacter muriae]